MLGRAVVASQAKCQLTWSELPLGCWQLRFQQGLIKVELCHHLKMCNINMLAFVCREMKF